MKPIGTWPTWALRVFGYALVRERVLPSLHAQIEREVFLRRRAGDAGLAGWCSTGRRAS